MSVLAPWKVSGKSSVQLPVLRDFPISVSVNAPGKADVSVCSLSVLWISNVLNTSSTRNLGKCRTHSGVSGNSVVNKLPVTSKALTQIVKLLFAYVFQIHQIWYVVCKNNMT